MANFSFYSISFMFFFYYLQIYFLWKKDLQKMKYFFLFFCPVQVHEYDLCVRDLEVVLGLLGHGGEGDPVGVAAGGRNL